MSRWLWVLVGLTLVQSLALLRMGLHLGSSRSAAGGVGMSAAPCTTTVSTPSPSHSPQPTLRQRLTSQPHMYKPDNVTDIQRKIRSEAAHVVCVIVTIPPWYWETSWLWHVLPALHTEHALRIIMNETFASDHFQTAEFCEDTVYVADHLNTHDWVRPLLAAAKVQNVKRLILVSTSDEKCNVQSGVYDSPLITAVFRCYWCNAKWGHGAQGRVVYAPLWHKVGFMTTHVFSNQHINVRKNLCAFMGTKNRTPLRSTVVSLLQDARFRALFACHVVVTDDKNAGLLPLEYSSLLTNTQFVICPEGTSPDTYRLWESLEAGAIPLVVVSKNPMYDALAAYEGHPVPTLNAEKFEEELTRFLGMRAEERGQLQHQLLSWYEGKRREFMTTFNELLAGVPTG